MRKGQMYERRILLSEWPGGSRQKEMAPPKESPL